MNSPGSVTRMIQDLRSEDPTLCANAAEQIWRRYFRGLLALARNNLNRRIRRREDEEDVLQSMYKSFCRLQQRSELELSSRDDLWRLLVGITLYKVRNAAAHHRRSKRDVMREQERVWADRDTPDSPQWVLEQMDSSEPSPTEAAALNDALESRLELLSDPELRRIALLKLEGYSNSEIADLKGCTERTVERKLERIRTKWEAYVGTTT